MMLLASCCWIYLVLLVCLTHSSGSADRAKDRDTHTDRHKSQTHAKTTLSHSLSPSPTPSPLLSSSSLSASASVSPSPLHIVFVYTVVPAVCKYGLPQYIQVSLQHTVRTQPDCVVVMASNYADCDTTRKQVSDIAGVALIDTTLIMSNRTKLFLNLSANIFASDYSNELWMTSALRFLNLEDIMTNMSLSEALHVEADNLLYGRVTALLPILRSHYPLAATPLNTSKTFITASVLWIATFRILKHFTDFFMDIATNENDRWKKFLQWIRPYACCKHGGLDPDAHGMGIKPFAVNEMSLMSYYHELYPERLMLLPVIPHFEGFRPRRNFAGNLNDFRPGCLESSFIVPGNGIWDPNSWGQYLGGTSRKRGRDKGFVDPSHIAGQAIIGAGCVPQMLCSAYAVNSSQPFQPKNEMNISVPALAQCMTAPYVKCSDKDIWFPIWNLHVHSKSTMDFQSLPCNCSTAAVVEYFPSL